MIQACFSLSADTYTRLTYMYTCKLKRKASMFLAKGHGILYARHFMIVPAWTLVVYTLMHIDLVAHAKCAHETSLEECS